MERKLEFKDPEKKNTKSKSVCLSVLCFVLWHLDPDAPQARRGENSNCVGWDLQWPDRWKQGEAGLARSRKVVEAVAMAGCRDWMKV